jgi:gliding motility-associated-like protein
VIVDNVTAINVLANDKNTSSASLGDSLYIRDITTKPTKGFVYINVNGTLSYLSTKDQATVSGGDTFQYLACNTKGYCSVGTVNITLIQDGCSAGQYQLTTTGTTTSTSFTPTLDAYITAGGSTNNGSATTIFLYGGGNVANSIISSLLQFNLSSISSTSTVTSGVLSLTASQNFTLGAATNSLNPANIYTVSKAWTESGVTGLKYDGTNSWTANPLSSSSDYSTTNGGTITVSNSTINSGTSISSSSLTTMLQKWVDGSVTNNGLIIIPSSTTTVQALPSQPRFHSNQSASPTLVPKLFVTYTTPATCSTIPTTYKPIAYPDTSSTTSNTAKTINVKNNDANYYGNTNNVTAVTTPKNGTATFTASSVTYTPSGSFVGTDTLTYTITDASNGQTSTATIRVTVSKVAPTIVRDNASTNSNTAVTINVGANDTDPQGSLTAPVITSLAKNGTVTVSGTNIIYTPSAKFTGNDTLIYSRSGTAADACSSALSDTALVVITVLNQAPVAINDSTTTFACVPVNINIKSNDTDAEGNALTVTIVSNPTNGTLTVNTDGTYKYSPNTNYTGTDQFTYTVKDPAPLTSNTGTVKITISGGANPNTAPLAVADADNTLVNQVVYTNVLANDSDPNNDPFTISVTASGLRAPSNGTIQLMGNKLIKYTPNANFTGTDTYEYQITDSHPSCSGSSSLTTKALVTITVKASPILTGGTIWNDVDYSANDSFDNIKTNSETGINPNGSIYVYLLDSTNKVIDYTPADDAGVYQLSSVPANTSKLSLVITTDIIAIGGTIATPVLPSTYINTSPMVRTFSTTTADISGYDFGIVVPSVTGGTITSTATSFCVTGTPSTITSSVNASGASSIQWQMSTTSGGSGFTNISGATSATYTPPSLITTTTWYRRKAIGTGGAFAYSNVLRLAVNALPTITISPAAVGVVPGTAKDMTASGASTYTWSPATNLSATTGATVTVTPAVAGTITYNVTGTDANGCVNTTQVNVSGSVLPVAGTISGPCAVPRDSVKTYTVTATNATSFVWTLPNGWTGTSTTNSINAKVGTQSGTISVTPYNGAVAGLPVSFTVSVINYGLVTLTGLPVTASGNNNSAITVTVTLYDADGNRIYCSGGTAIVKFCENNPGTFTPVIDNNNGTYTTTVTASANTLDICGTVGGPPIVNKQRVTFTGPQGSIKASVPQLSTETPKLTFTMSAGRAPFIVIYKSAKSNKTDTLNNYTSGTVTPVALIPSTTLYTLVSIIDANGERRDNNFTRDTASVVVLAPKVIITLKADAAIADKDSTWITILRVRTKNIGDLDLTNSQAKLDLKTVFPNPVTFKLDSVRYSGTIITPNGSYDGISASDLFAKLNNRSKNGKAIEMIPVMDESGEVNMVSQPINATDGNSVDGIRVFTNKNGGAGSIDTDDGPVVVEDGHSLYMFGPQSYLPIGVEADIILYLHVKPNGYTDPFVMQAVALGTGTTDGATALTTSISNDNNDINSHPEITKQGDPIPTVVNLFPRAVIGSSLNAGTPVLQGDGSYNVPFTIKLKNYGNLNLQAVQLGLNLLRSIGTPSTFTIVGPLVSTGDLLINASYDGKSDTNMLAANSILGYNKGFSTITFTVNIVTNQLSSLYRLQATAYGFSDQQNTTVNDLSTDGLEPDPDGNNIPSEKIKTIIAINLPIPPLVPAPIGIRTASGIVTSKAYCEKALGTDVIVPTSLNTGGIDPYEYQWQSSADNTAFTDIVGATDSTYTTGSILSSVYVRRQVISGSQFKFSNSVYIQILPLPVKPVISGTATQVVGKGSAILTSTTAPAYKWTTGDITRSTTAFAGGLYTVTVTDANGCSNTSSVFTVTTLDPYKVADVQKLVSKAPVLQSDGSFILGFTFLSSNLRSEVLDSVKIKDDLSKVFPATVDYQVTQIQASGKLKANALYNGNSQIDLLSDVSQLGGLTTDSVQVFLKVNPNGFSGKLNNTAVLTANSPFGTFSVTSNDPTVGNGVSVRNPTPFTIPVIDIFIPSGFSPNHDGVNDNFVISKPFGTTINLEIFNRWGNAVFKAADYKNEWDGRGNQPNNILGEMLPDGTYYYVATATDKFTGNIRKFAGFVTLKR